MVIRKNHGKEANALTNLFSPGDAVTVRVDLNTSDRYHMIDDGSPSPHKWNCATRNMVELAGRIVHIVGTRNDYDQYSIAEDDYFWTDEMFEEYFSSDACAAETATVAELTAFLYS